MTSLIEIQGNLRDARVGQTGVRDFRAMRTLLFTVLAAALLTSAVGVMPAVNSTAAGSVALEYLVTISQPETHLAHVQLRIGGLAQTTLYLSTSLRDSAFLGNLIVTDQSGTPLSFTLAGATLTIDTAGVSTVVVTYDIEPSDWFGSGEDREYLSYIAAEYAMVQTQNLLFVTYQPVSTIAIAFSLPAGWTAVTAWSEEDGAFYPTDVDDLLKRIALGPFEIICLELVGVPVRLGIQPGAPRSGIIYDTQAFFASEYGVFDDFAYDRFMAAFAAENVPPFHNGGAAAKNTFYLPSQYSPRVLAHEMFHMWNGNAIVPCNGDELWFLEGGTEFYTTDTVFKTHRLSPTNYVGDYTWFVERVAELEQQLDISLLEAGQRAMAEGGAVKDFAYYKGRLFVFLLNERVYQATGGQKNMDDVMRYLYVHHNVHQGGSCVTNDDLLAALETVAGTDLDNEFNLYLYGKGSIPVESYLQDSDQDGLARAIEGRYGTSSASVDTDNDGLGDGAEIVVWCTDPLDADTFDDGILDGDRVQVKVDGRGGGWGGIAPMATDRQGDIAWSVEGADLSALYLATDGYFLYIALVFFEPPTNPDLLYQLHVDADLDAELEYYLVQRPQRFIGFGEYRDGAGFELDTMPIRNLTALAMEYRLPWHLVGSPTQFNVGFRIRPVQEDLTIDQLDVSGYWLGVNRAEIPFVRNDVTFPERIFLPFVQRS